MKERDNLRGKQYKRPAQQRKSKNASTSPVNEAEVIARLKRAEPHLKKRQAKHQRKQAQKLLEDQKYEEAIKIFQQAIKLDPVNWQSYFYLGRAYSALNRNGLALNAYKKALKSQPYNAQILYQIGETNFNLKHFSQAYEAFYKATKRNFEYKNVLIEKGNFLLKEGQRFSQKNHFEEAIYYFEQALLFCPDNAGIYLEMGDALIHVNLYQEALSSCNCAIRIAPKNARAYIFQGDLLCQLKRFHEALSAYEMALNLNNKSAMIVKKENRLAILGHHLLEQQLYQDALRAYNRAIQLDSQNAEYYLEKGFILYNLKNYHEAFRAFNQSMSIDPTIAGDYLCKKSYVLHAIYHVFFSSQSLKEAREVYEFTVKIDPYMGKEYFSQGGKLLETAKKQYELRYYVKSRLTFIRVIAFNPQYEKDYLSLTEDLVALGKKHLKDGRPEKALITFDDAIKFNPTYASAYKEKGDVLFDQELYTDAYTNYSRAVQINRSNNILLQEKSDTLTERGNVFYKQGKLQDALALYEYALQFNKNNARAYDAKIQIHRIRGEKEEEKRTLRLKNANLPDSVGLSEKPFIYSE